MSLSMETMNSALAPSSLGTTRKPTPSEALGQNDFFKLLTTQLGNQNPLQPMDNGEFISQMAQFSTASGIEQMQKSFGQLTESLRSNQGLAAASLVGHRVLSAGNQLNLDSGGQAMGGLRLEDAAEVAVQVKDASGQVIRTLNLGGQDAGTLTFTWDGSLDAGGQAAEGKYSFAVQALSGGKLVDSEALNTGKVQSVLLSGSEIRLELGDGLGSVPLNQINRIM